MHRCLTVRVQLAAYKYVLTVSISFIPLDSVRALLVILSIVTTTTIPCHHPPTRLVVEVVLPG